MDYWAETSDDLRKLERDLEKGGEPLSIDQRIQLVNIKAVLALGQEISAINPDNSTTRRKDGTKVNGWGLPVE